jgi:hypothetical protein
MLPATAGLHTCSLRRTVDCRLLFETRVDPRLVACLRLCRYYPIAGWSKKLLPTDRHRWSDQEGKKELRKTDFDLPAPNWTWTSEWGVDKTDTTDDDGWEYAINFGMKYQKGSTLQSVRRRCAVSAPIGSAARVVAWPPHPALVCVRCWMRTLAPKEKPAKHSDGGEQKGDGKHGEERKKMDFQSATVSCFENQRYYPVVGWSSTLLPTVRSLSRLSLVLIVRFAASLTGPRELER